MIRWILAIPFFLLFGVLAVCQIGSLMENSRNGKGTSVFPFIGGLSGVIGLAILDWKLALYWFWVPLLLDRFSSTSFSYSLAAFFKRFSKKNLEELLMNDNWHDKVEWHYKSAFENYCRTHGVEEESLSEEESDLIADFAGTHIGLFWMWIVLHHFEGEIHRDPEDQNAIRMLESGKITGNDFIRTYCDNQICEENISDEILDFVRTSYDRYLHEYEKWVEHNRNGLLYQLPCTWELYSEIEPMINRIYENYKKGKSRKSFWARLFHI